MRQALRRDHWDNMLEAITRATTLIVTWSLGSGPGGDVIYLFQNDICGEQLHRPRHARSFGDLHGPAGLHFEVIGFSRAT